MQKLVDCSKELAGKIQNHVPALSELKEVVEKSLAANFENVSVDVRDCPDLSAEPFSLQSSGFGKNLRIADIGGPSNLYPRFHTHSEFDLREIAKVCELPSAALFGPGAGHWPTVGVNSEMVVDANLASGKVSTKVAKIDDSNPKGYAVSKIQEPKFNMMANIAISEPDQAEQVVHFKASIRKGSKNLTNTIRDALAEYYGEKPVSLAGLFIIQKGKAKLHVMPDFPGCPFESNEEVDKWLRYFEMEAPLVCASILHSYDPGMSLRLEHTHCYSEHGEGGHYHYDTTPEDVVYEGWFAPANHVYRIDKC
ncbi:unnamed protein product [Caenorhabditis auriculariae]|uniref:DUF1907 domain-containing protein n=1 Tax=Caenorhabditis auriculariae TaxID=2777116 RepID=A0A8S1HD17_9PELO|nr:unnamed protein product [Caenorhabditis auriculariae]